jgi:hypothetical protein
MIGYGIVVTLEQLFSPLPLGEKASKLLYSNAN